VSIGTQHEQTGIKIIVAFEDEYNAYQGTLAATIKILRPDGVVVTADPKEISRVATRFDPDIIIGSGFNDEDLDAVGAWIDLSLDPTRATKVQVGGEYSEMINPTLDKLLEIIEEVAQLTQTSDL
jgi:hypothetical protein